MLQNLGSGAIITSVSDIGACFALAFSYRVYSRELQLDVQVQQRDWFCSHHPLKGPSALYSLVQSAFPIIKLQILLLKMIQSYREPQRNF